MTSTARLSRTAAMYVAMLVAAIGIFLIVRFYGEQLSPAAQPSLAPVARPDASFDLFWHVLLALAVVVIVGRTLGSLFKFVGQPPVIGEIVAGIVLGPSLLGHVAPDAAAYLLPAAMAPSLDLLAQLGVVIYMFLVGLELNPDLLRGQIHSTIVTSHASIVVPFVLGAALALVLYPPFAPAGVAFTHFALFLGVSMAITAFPVLARILAHRRMTHTPLGALALTCAAINDVTAWCLLAFVVGVVQASSGAAIVVVLLTLGFIAVMFLVIRPLFARWAAGSEPPSHGQLSLALLALLLAALTTEAIGIHAIFGAFLLGAIMPRGTALAAVLKHSGELVTLLILPAFFAFTGMRTEIGLVSTGYEWAMCGLIVGIATLGKFGGTFVAARVSGLDRRDAASLGVLMNTRGLMELIVLNVGLDLGVITPTLFTMMVLMALVTTVATTPALKQLRPDVG